MAIVRNIVKENYFRDSIQLMQLSEEAKKIPGVLDVALVMATETNKEILERLGLLTEEGSRATKNDLVIAVKVENEEQLNSSLASIENMLTRTSISAAPTITERIFYSVDSAIEFNPDANLALISIPGEYVKDVAVRLLEKGIHIHIFSDHVPIEHELELKKIASSKGLLVLGPGAGTSIINGKAVAFANSVRRGSIGIVAAAGTGLQEVSVLLDKIGLGVSQGLGVGGNDVKESIGGIMTLDCIKALENDEETSLIMVVSKPPDPPVVKKIIKSIEESNKKFVLCFLGSQTYKIPKKLVKRVYSCRSLHSAVLRTASMVSPETYKEAGVKISMKLPEIKKLVKDLSRNLRPEQKYIRALYTGGTLMYESLLIYQELLKDVYSNAPLDPKYKLADSFKSYKHTVVDLGEEEFTAGRAHPMIDPTVRKLRIVEEAKDPEVAVITMDFMLGYGSNPDPVEAMASSILEASKIAAEEGRKIVFMGHVCGTELDPQDALKQEEKLKNMGVVTFPSNALMAFTSALLVKRGKIAPEKIKKVYKMFLEK